MKRQFFLLLLATAAVSASFLLGRARADGPPGTSPLFYAGTIEQDGALAQGPLLIGLNLVADENPADPEVRLCTVPAATLPVVDGRFRLDVSGCVDAVRANPDVFVEVIVDSAPLPRQKLGAVPYALEAERAQRAALADAVAGGAIDAAALAANSVTSGAIANAAVGASELVDGSVGSAKIAANAVGSAQLQNGAVGSSELAVGGVTSAAIASGAITSSQLADDAVTSVAILDNSVGAAEIAPGAVGSSELADGSISAIELGSSAVTTTALADNAITLQKMADNAVSSLEIADNAVGTSEIAAGAVGSSELADGSVGAADVADGSLTGDDVANASLNVDDLALRSRPLVAGVASGGTLGFQNTPWLTAATRINPGEYQVTTSISIAQCFVSGANLRSCGVEGIAGGLRVICTNEAGVRTDSNINLLCF